MPPDVDEQQCGMEYYAILNSSREDDITSKLEEYFKSFGLSALGMGVVNHWAHTAAIDTSGRLDRLKKWFLQILNNTNHPRTISPWQKGCPNLLPGLRSLSQWELSYFQWTQRVHEAIQVSCSYPI